MARPRPASQDLAAYFGPGYHVLYRDYLIPREQTDAEAAFLARALRPRAGQRWLDLPCGYGRHLAALRARAAGVRLFGGDLSLPYLRDAQRGAGDARLARCDMRRLPFADGSFHVVLSLLNSFGYFPAPPAEEGRRRGADGNRAVLREFGRVLRLRGRLVLDLPNRRGLLDCIRRQPRLRYGAAEWEVTETFAWDAAGECLLNQTQWRWPGGAETHGYRLRVYTPAQIARLLAREGFTIERHLGDFSGRPFDPAESDRMLLICRRE